MLKFNCKVVGGNIPEGEFVIVEVDAENAGYALPLAIDHRLPIERKAEA